MNPTSSTRSALVVFATLTLLATGCGGEPGAGAETAAGVDTAAAALKSVGISSLTISSPTVTAGNSITATVTLSGAAESSSGGAIVYVSFRNTILAGPKLVRIPNGMRSATFALYSNPFLSASASTSVSATTSSPDPASFATQNLFVIPASIPPTGAAPQVSSLTLSPPAVKSGSPSTGTVTLTAPAPASGAVVQLANSGDFFSLDADLPPVLVIPAGATSATFPIRTHLSNGLIDSVDEIVVGNYFGGAYRGAYLSITR